MKSITEDLIFTNMAGEISSSSFQKHSVLQLASKSCLRLVPLRGEKFLTAPELLHPRADGTLGNADGHCNQ